MKKKILRILILFIFLGLLIYRFYPEEKLPEGVKIDKLVVYKSKRELLAYSDGKLIKIYKVSLGWNPVGDKEFEWDKKTPEGNYFINDKNPNSIITHKNLGVSYPNREDIEYARKFGKSAGGNIKIHGLGSFAGFLGKFHRWFDLSLGCIVVTNPEIDELYKVVKLGTPVEINP